MRAGLVALLLSGCSVLLDFGGGTSDARPADARADAVLDAAAADAGDGFEPNDSLTTAWPLDASGSYGPLTISPVGDVDFFRFGTPGGSANTRVEIVFMNADGDLDLALLDNDGATLFVSDGALDGEVIEQPLAAGSYIAQVRGAAGIEETVYTLIVTTP
jgi:hypothetical protein